MSELLKTIDTKDVHLINGYIREHEENLFSDKKDNPYYNIAGLINHLCLLFWYDLNEFDPNLCSKSIKVSDNGKIITSEDGKFTTCYGKKIISSTQNGTYVWTLQNISKNDDEMLIFINIGIDNANCLNINEGFHGSSKRAQYAYFVGGVIYSWIYGKDSDEEWPSAYDYKSEIIMKLVINNSGDSYISFKINDAEERIAYNKIETGEDLQYRLAVCIVGPNNPACVELLDFKVIN